MASRVRRMFEAIGGLGASLISSMPTLYPTKKIEVDRSRLAIPEAYVDPTRLFASGITMPYNPSVLVTRKGLRIFDLMKLDEAVKSCLTFKKYAISSAGWEIVSPADQQEDWEVTAFVRDNFNHIEGGVNEGIVRKILLGLDYGYSVSEKIYAEPGAADWAKGKLTLKKLNSAKPHYIDIDTDPYGDVLALLQRWVPGSLREVPLPPDKFVVYSHDKEFENPYGRSDLEACYRAWWVKDNAYKWLAVMLERYGMPPLFLFYNQNQYVDSELDELKKVVRSMQNATMGLIPRDDKESLEFWSANLAAGAKDVFLAALTRFDADISKGLLMPSLIGAGGEGGNQSGGGESRGSLARANVHFKNFLIVVRQIQDSVATNAINSQIIKQLCDLNFSGLKSYPTFRFMDPNDESESQIFELWSLLVAGKVVNRIADDEIHIRKALGFPENENPVIEPLPADVTAQAAIDAKAAMGGDKVPKDKQTPEMKKFAEENEGEWFFINGHPVCLHTYGYNPDESRVPPGNPDGGEWTSGGGGGNNMPKGFVAIRRWTAQDFRHAWKKEGMTEEKARDIAKSLRAQAEDNKGKDPMMHMIMKDHADNHERMADYIKSKKKP